MTRKPNGAYLIESAPKYRQYAAAKAAREIVERILAPLDEFIAGRATGTAQAFVEAFMGYQKEAAA